MRKRLHPGFTLLELTMYIGLSFLVLISVFSFYHMLLEDQIRQEQHNGVLYNSTQALNTILYYGQRASSLHSSTDFVVNPGVLVLNTSQGQTIIDTYQKDVVIGGEELTITKLRYQIGASPAYDLTTDNVDVTRFILINLSHPSVESVKVYLTVEAVNPGGSKAYAAEQALETTVTIRS